MYSKIFAYNPTDKKPSDTYRRFNYLGGSDGLDWDGFQIEKLETTGPVDRTIYFEDYYFSMALNDMSFTVNESLFETKAGEIFLTPRRRPFNLVNKSDFTTIRCTMTHEFLKKHYIDKAINHVRFTENYQVDDPNLRYFMLLIYEQALQKTAFSDPYLNHLFGAFVTHYIHAYSNYRTAYDERLMNAATLAKINRYLDANLSENISSMTLANLVGMSNYTFLNAFKDFTKDTPHQYQLKKKLKAAKTMLSSSGASIIEISHALGFTDSSHFSKFFKKQTGVSPSKYRKR